MPLTAPQREHVISTALEILRHPHRERLLGILEDRLAHGDYPDADEQSLDEIAYAVARAVGDELGEPTP